MKIIKFLIALLLIFSTQSLSYKEDPEIEDKSGDTFGYLDIISAWFYGEGDYLYIAIKVANLKIMLRTVYTVFWKCNEKNYHATMFVNIVGPLWMYGYFEEGVGWITKGTEGSYNLEEGLIKIKIPKNEVGFKKGDKLTNTFAFSWQKIIFGWIPWFYDRAPDAGYGKDYVIQS